MQQSDLDRYLVQKQFPGMPQPESNLCRAWLRTYGLEYDKFYFNYRVGQGRPLIEGLPPEIQRQAKLLSQLRIDVLGFVNGRVDIIEVKDRAQAASLGQIVAYQKLWNDDNGSTPIRKLIIIARDSHPDVETVYKHAGIDLAIVVPEDFTL
jgi:hypothetical protein